MIQKTKTISILALAAACLSSTQGFAATAGSTNAPDASARLNALLGDPVVARAKGGIEIRQKQLDEALIGLKAGLNARGQNVTPDQMLMLERQVLNDILGLRLIVAKASDADKAKGKEQFVKAVAKLKTDSKLTDEEFDQKLATSLRIQGITRDEWNQQRTDQSIAGVVLERELKIAITDADAKKFYEEYPARFEKPEMIRASHVLIGTRDAATNSDLPEDQKKAKRKLAEDVRKKALAGEDFAKLAKEYSDDPGSKDNGGEYTFPRGQMVPEFESAAFSLGTNQVSDVVTTQFGYHVIKVSEKIPAKKVLLDDVMDDLKEGLKSQEIQKQLPDYLKLVMKDANVEILDDRLKDKGDALETKPVEKKSEKK
jgi:peptidyl-prolyl cis-trans isomerase C